jgi:hypothetical protein
MARKPSDPFFIGEAVMALPETMEAIRAQGWKYVNSKVCSCSVRFEWHKRWDVDQNKWLFLPIEFDELSGRFLNHFATCVDRKQHRKIDPKMLSKKQLKAKEKEEKEAERKAAKGPSLFEE